VTIQEVLNVKTPPKKIKDVVEKVEEEKPLLKKVAVMFLNAALENLRTETEEVVSSALKNVQQEKNMKKYSRSVK
tara:strand:+ start:419 stop:643 length:225 start_codon:yes stop_codon:yes gene_type:complete